MKIAIIGAGMAGVTAARNLSSVGEVTLFDKSRGVSGRMSTRRTDDFEFDHGAQYFTAKDSRFAAAIKEVVATGHVAPWASDGLYLRGGEYETDTGASRYVSVPRMNSWVKAMAADLDVRLNARVNDIVQEAGLWTLHFEDGEMQSGFDWVIMAAPPEQVSAIYPYNFAQREALSSVKMDACFALMIGLHHAPDLPWETLRQSDGPAAWIAVNSVKPGRPVGGHTLMVHSGPEWSNAHIDNRDNVVTDMISAASKAVGFDLTDNAYQTLHFWRYAAVRQGAGQPCLVDVDNRLIAAGDWCLGGRVEGAYLSGLAAAKAINQSA